MSDVYDPFGDEDEQYFRRRRSLDEREPRRYHGRWLPSAVRVRRNREIVVLDTETTGLLDGYGPMPAVWEIGAVRLRPGEAVSEAARFSALLHLPYLLPSDIGSICDVPLDLPQRKGTDRRETLVAFARFAEGAVLAGHNLRSFDAPLLAYAYEEVGLPVPTGLESGAFNFDTMRMAAMVDAYDGRWRLPMSLADLADELELSRHEEAGGAHRALADALTCADLLDALIDFTASATNRDDPKGAWLLASPGAA